MLQRFIFVSRVGEQIRSLRPLGADAADSLICWTSSGLRIRETVTDSLDDLVGASMTEARERSAGTAEVAECVRVSAGGCHQPNSSEGDSNTECRFRRQVRRAR